MRLILRNAVIQNEAAVAPGRQDIFPNGSRRKMKVGVGRTVLGDPSNSSHGVHPGQRTSSLAADVINVPVELDTWTEYVPAFSAWEFGISRFRPVAPSSAVSLKNH